MADNTGSKRCMENKTYTVNKNPSGSEKMRIDRLLSNFGYGSRSEIKKLVKNSAIHVDGITIKDAAMRVDPENSKIEVNGKQLNYRKFIYVVMNKPAGVISATYDNKLKTAIDLLPDEFSCFDLFPAGRLDIDTEGMLLLTNDGQLAHELLSPKKHVPKRYYALIDGIVTEEDIKLFEEGIVLDDGYKTMSAELEIIAKSRCNFNEADGSIEKVECTKKDRFINDARYSEIELVLHEGKFHQVKRMFEATGKKVTYLKRIQMGGLKLDETLKPGECRELTADEVNLLKCRS